MRPPAPEEPPSVLLRNARVLAADRVLREPTAVRIEGGLVVALGEDASGRLEGAVDCEGAWALPGWIDLQLNDIEWLAKGPAAPDAHAERIQEVLAYQVARGVTGAVLATLAAPIDSIVAYLEGMARVLAGGSVLERAFLGGLVEGTFMNPEYHGAHNPDWVLPPDAGVLDRLLGTGAVRLLNVAPETAPEALELIARATRRGVVVGCGHAKPHAKRLRAAIDAGLRYIIHLGNGPTGSHWKRFHDGGMLEESLRNDRLAVTVIADGYHVHPQLVRDWIERKEVPRVIGVSDASFATGSPGGRFEVFGVTGEPAEEGAYFKVVPPPGSRLPNPLSSDVSALFGSAAGMREVFETLLNLLTADMDGVYYRRHRALGLEEALAAASRMCSANPAGLLGLADRGTLAPGRRGDVVVVRIEGDPGRYRVELVATFLEGRRFSGTDASRED